MCLRIKLMVFMNWSVSDLVLTARNEKIFPETKYGSVCYRRKASFLTVVSLNVKHFHVFEFADWLIDVKIKGFFNDIQDLILSREGNIRGKGTGSTIDKMKNLTEITNLKKQEELDSWSVALLVSKNPMIGREPTDVRIIGRSFTFSTEQQSLQSVSINRFIE